MKKIKLPPELQELYDNTPVMSEAETKELGDAIQALNSDPQYIADEVKEHFLNTILAEMRLQGLNQNQLAEKWGKHRQYVSNILNPDNSKNFTISTMVELSMLLGLRMKCEFSPLDESAQTTRYTTAETLSRVAEPSEDYKADSDGV